jgi:steroid delta-isomerase-like uncharacterized protein
MTADENREFVRSRVIGEIWNGGRDDLVPQAFAPDFVGHDPDRPDLGGPDAVAASVRTFHAAFPDFSISVDDLIAADDKVVWRYTMGGTHAGPFLGVDGTGRRVSTTGITIFRLAGGMLREGWINFDALGLLRQFGAVAAGP